MKTTDDLTQFITQWMATHLQLEASEIDPGQTFLFYGMDSMDAVNLSSAVSEFIGREISPDAAYEYPTIQDFANYALGT